MTVKRSITALLLFVFAACAQPRAEPDAPPDIAADAAAPDATPRKRMAFIGGQSNGVGTGRPVELTGELARYLDPYPSVWYASSVGNDGDPPDVHASPGGPLSPRMGRLDVFFGIELSLGRALDESSPGGWAIAKHARGSTALTSEWDPEGMYPRSSTLADGPNAFEMLVADMRARALEADAEITDFIWIQVESDACCEEAARNYDRRLIVFADLLRLYFPGLQFWYTRLSIQTGYNARDLIRAEQAKPERVRDYMHMLDTDRYPLRADKVHTTGPALIEMGIDVGARIASRPR